MNKRINRCDSTNLTKIQFLLGAVMSSLLLCSSASALSCVDEVKTKGQGSSFIEYLRFGSIAEVQFEEAGVKDAEGKTRGVARVRVRGYNGLGTKETTIREVPLGKLVEIQLSRVFGDGKLHPAVKLWVADIGELVWIVSYQGNYPGDSNRAVVSRLNSSSTCHTGNGGMEITEEDLKSLGLPVVQHHVKFQSDAALFSQLGL